MTANNLPPRLYYHLDEAAQLLGCTERDLIHWGALDIISMVIFIDEGSVGSVHQIKCDQDRVPYDLLQLREVARALGVLYETFADPEYGYAQGVGLLGSYEALRIEREGFASSPGIRFITDRLDENDEEETLISFVSFDNHKVTSRDLLIHRFDFDKIKRGDFTGVACSLSRFSESAKGGEQPAPLQDMEPLLKHAETAPNLALLFEAYRQFWSTYDPEEPATAPISEDVEKWLDAQGVAKRVAEVMAQILRPEGLPSGPRKVKRRS